MSRALAILFSFTTVVAIVYALYRFGFLRKPARNTPNNDSLFVSPANGTIISIRPFTESTFIETKNSPAGERGAMQILAADVSPVGTIITIQLNLTDVHYQRAPMGGQVVSTAYTAGNHNNAILMPGEQSSRYENEHNEILLQTTAGLKYKVVQIAGFIARSIKCDLKPGHLVAQGQVIGSIEIGSQVTVVLPAQMQIVAKVGDYLIDGETIIAKV